MEYRHYIKYIETINAVMRCAVCGSDVASAEGKEAFCHFCEAYVYPEDKMQQEATAALNEVQDRIKKAEIENAIGAAMKMQKSSKPDVLYALGVFYSFFSDYRYYSLDYNLGGFMEGNSKNIYESLDLIAKSKEMLFKAIKIAGKDAEVDPNLAYVVFLSNIRLGRRVQAERALEMLEKTEKRSQIKDHARMIYAMATNDKDALKYISSGIVELNSFYYLAVYLIRMKRYKESRRLLEALIKKCHMPMALYTLHRLDLFEQETAL